MSKIEAKLHVLSHDMGGDLDTLEKRGETGVDRETTIARIKTVNMATAEIARLRNALYSACETLNGFGCEDTKHFLTVLNGKAGK